MGDLDDFFARKDKKKAKGKPKFLTADELVKNLEDTSKREAALVKPKKLEPVANAEPVEPVASVEGEIPKEQVPEPVPVVEEEWKEFEEEQRKDYTGLKIGQLNVNDDDESSEGEDEEELDSDGNNVAPENSARRQGGPWKKVIPAEEVTQIQMDPVEKPSSKVYISPALRNAQASVLGKTKIRNRNAPDITNADFFPTLGAARPEEQRKKKNEPAFEEVRHGGRLQRVQETAVSGPSSAGNRFQSLDDDDS